MFNAKKMLSFVAVSAVLTAGAFAQATGTSTTASATSAPATSAPAGPLPTKIGVINIQRVIGATNEARRDFEALMKKFEPKGKEIEGLKTEIETLQGQLQSQGQTLTDTDRAQRVKTLENKQKSFQRIQEDAQKEFTEEQQALINRIGQKLMQVVDQYAKQNGYAMVVNASGEGDVLWASDQTNISQQILDLYNKQSGVPAPAADAPSAAKPGAKPSATPQNPPKKPTTGGTTPR
jgi:outer membrane protein